MNPLTQSKKRTIPALLIAVGLACFALSPTAQALLPPPAPDGGYLNANTAEGYYALFSLTTGFNNTANGASALSWNTTGYQNTATGVNALGLNTKGFDNTATGVAALTHNRGNFNTASGGFALDGNTTGSLNTATGFSALSQSTTGLWNTADGARALESNTTGNFNTAIGVQALSSNITGSSNTANGLSALYSNTTGYQNTATGREALSHNITGTGNIANGYRALFSNTGSFNVAVGFTAGGNLTTGSDNIDIGALGVAGESNTMRIGTVKQTTTFISGIRGVTTANANAVPVVIDSAGQLGTVSSSRRFKDDIKPMDKASEAIMGLEPVTFHYKTDNRATPQFGLIAEEVAKVNPNLVVRNDNGEIYTVRYDAVNAMLLNEFLKEHRKNEEREKTIAELKSGMTALAATVKEQAAQIQKVSAELEASKPAPQVVNNP